MSRVLGYMCSDDTLTYCVMEEVAEELGRPEQQEEAGQGLGWVQEGRTLLRKQPPQGATGVALESVMLDIPAREIVAYECDRDSKAIDTLDLQPFSFRSWVYAQDGNLTALEEHRDAILGELPDHIRRNIDGDSIEELCFHVFLSTLQSKGGFGLSQSNPKRCVDALVESVGEIEQRLDGRAESEEVFASDVAVISERLMICVAGSDNVWYRPFHGIEEPGGEPLFAGHRPQAEKHPHFRAILMTNRLEKPGEEWEKVPARHAMWVDGKWNVHIESLEEWGLAG
jgi:glutamine amidotransferase